MTKIKNILNWCSVAFVFIFMGGIIIYGYAYLINKSKVNINKQIKNAKKVKLTKAEKLQAKINKLNEVK